MSKLMQESLDWARKRLIEYEVDPNTVLTPEEWDRLAEYDLENSEKDEDGNPEVPMEPDHSPANEEGSLVVRVSGKLLMIKQIIRILLGR